MSQHWNQFSIDVDNPKRQKTSSTTYEFQALNNEVAMESTPDLLQPETVSSLQTPSLMVAETNFFNQQNQDYWHRTDLSHLRPYDFPYVRALLQQEPCDTLSPEDIKHKEQVCTSIQVVSRAYEEKYLREPIGKERACIMCDQCQGLHLPYVTENAFILR